MRVPKVHVPYLIGVGLFGVAHAVSLFLPAQGAAAVAAESVSFGALVLHFIWLHAIYKDGEGRLGKELPMPASRVVIVALIACVFLPIWSAFALMVLLRSVVIALGDGAERRAPFLARAARDAPALVVVGSFLVGVSFVIAIQLEVAGAFTDGEVRGRPVAFLGTVESYAVSAFFLLCAGYWLWFVARAIPALYRAMESLDPQKDAGAGAGLDG